jgi:hypothetical protein
VWPPVTAHPISPFSRCAGLKASLCLGAARGISGPAIHRCCAAAIFPLPVNGVTGSPFLQRRSRPPLHAPLFCRNLAGSIAGCPASCPRRNTTAVGTPPPPHVRRPAPPLSPRRLNLAHRVGETNRRSPMTRRRHGAVTVIRACPVLLCPVRSPAPVLGWPIL